MSLITLTSIILIGLSLFEMAGRKHPRLQNDIFYVAFVVAFFIYLIKYYYGPDIRTYVPYYEGIAPLNKVFASPDSFFFEVGFTLLCSLFRTLGISFWGLTAFITTVYFTAIYLILMRLPRYRTLALAIIFVLDGPVIMVALRQTISIACFVFMALSYSKKDYLLTALFAILTILMHKAGAFVVLSVVPLMLLDRRPMPRYLFVIFAVTLTILAFVPFVEVLESLLKVVPFSSAYRKSIHHHLTLGRSVQVIFMLYFLAFLCLSYFVDQKRSSFRLFGAVALIGGLYIACFYQYFYVLNRMRSFFLPIITVYVIYYVTVQNVDNHRVKIGPILRTALGAMTLAFIVHQTISLERGYQTHISKLYEPSTIFELRHTTQRSLRDRQIQKALVYWERDFMANKENMITVN